MVVFVLSPYLQSTGHKQALLSFSKVLYACIAIRAIRCMNMYYTAGVSDSILLPHFIQ